MNNKENLFTFVLVPSVVVSFALGFLLGHRGIDSRYVMANYVDETQVKPELFEPYWKAWKILDEKFVTSASSTPQDKIYGSIQGLASSFKDPYTVFFPPVEAKMFQDDISGNFEGVGMEIAIKNNQLQVVTPIKDSPAFKAGVKAGDLILKIGTDSTNDMTVEKAVKLIRGKKGTTIKITFLPIGASKTVERSIVRDIINIPTIETSEKGDVFVIKLYTFTAQSQELFRQGLRKFVMSGKNKLILDLRGNPGGFLDSAWDISSWFLPVGDVVVTEDFGKNRTPNIMRSKGYNVFGKDLKMVILVDQGSASASEIVAGALSQHGIAKLVGTRPPLERL
jgi:carboxyl-terminal processing protease